MEKGGRKHVEGGAGDGVSLDSSESPDGAQLQSYCDLEGGKRSQRLGMVQPACRSLICMLSVACATDHNEF